MERIGSIAERKTPAIKTPKPTTATILKYWLFTNFCNKASNNAKLSIVTKSSKKNGHANNVLDTLDDQCVGRFLLHILEFTHRFIRKLRVGDLGLKKLTKQGRVQRSFPAFDLRIFFDLTSKMAGEHTRKGTIKKHE